MRSHKWLIATIIAVLCLAAAGTAVAWSSDWGPFASSDESSAVPSPTSSGASDEPTGSATTSPAPTPSGSATPTTSPEPSAAPTATQTPAPGLAPATVVITYATWAPETASVEVGSYVTVVEDSGQCTLTLTRGAVTRTQSIDALPDVSTMSCGGFLMSGDDLSTGTWSAVVTYTSEKSSGQSDPVEVTVP